MAVLSRQTGLGAADDFPAKSALFKFKQKVTGPTASEVTKNVQIMVSLKHLRNFWRTLAVPLINCKINLILFWSENFIISSVPVNQGRTFGITETLYSSCNFINSR